MGKRFECAFADNATVAPKARGSAQTLLTRYEGAKLLCATLK